MACRRHRCGDPEAVAADGGVEVRRRWPGQITGRTLAQGYAAQPPVPPVSNPLQKTSGPIGGADGVGVGGGVAVAVGVLVAGGGVGVSVAAGVGVAVRVGV